MTPKQAYQLGLSVGINKQANRMLEHGLAGAGLGGLAGGGLGLLHHYFMKDEEEKKRQNALVSTLLPALAGLLTGGVGGALHGNLTDETEAYHEKLKHVAHLLGRSQEDADFYAKKYEPTTEISDAPYPRLPEYIDRALHPEYYEAESE